MQIGDIIMSASSKANQVEFAEDDMSQYEAMVKIEKKKKAFKKKKMSKDQKDKAKEISDLLATT